MRIEFLIIGPWIINYQIDIRLFHVNFTIIKSINFLIFFGKIFFDKFNLITLFSFEVDFLFFYR